ncbi:MAG TPA: fused MFS/spermidine synthase [Steroidobacteraceae bacterium]
MPIYALSVLLGGWLLFLVQPLIARLILPWFGGSSSVWSAALVFFQVSVLAGYSYGHWLTTRTRPRVQATLHTILLVAACALMPIVPSDTWRPTDSSDPTLRILLLLGATVGLPALLLSSTSPLMQVWCMRRTGSQVPYWLFALSNFGSMLALLSFPFLLEPAFGVRSLALGWSALFGVFALVSIAAGWMSRGSESIAAKGPAASEEPAPSIARQSLWLLFPACACALLVSVSAHLSTNIAPIPLLWVAPLALYLLSFVLTFGALRLYDRRAFFPWLAVALGSMAFLYTTGESNLHIQYQIPLYLFGLFMSCVACHGELALRRPGGAHVTRFYLCVALGGALGGIFVGLIAPHLFDTQLELALLLVLIAILCAVPQWYRRGSKHTLWPVRIAIAGGIGALTTHLALAEVTMRRENLLMVRNFYGVLRVRDELLDTGLARRNLIHGTISHGYQFLVPALRNIPGSYFSPTSGVGRALLALHDQGSVRYGVIGLGAGVLSSYARKGDSVTLYEINPAVSDIAEGHFTFLKNAREVGAKVEVLLGDARLTLERQAPQGFDLLIVDAFSSDAIPTHLLTREAFALYFRHLRPNGALALHISNRYLDLEPVCAMSARHVNRPAFVLKSPSDGMFDASVWVIVTSNEALLEHSALKSAQLRPARARAGFVGWTDQYSSVWPILTLN